GCSPDHAGLQHRGDELAPRRDRRNRRARCPRHPPGRSSRLALVHPPPRAGQYHHHSAAAEVPRAQPGRERLAVHARQLALQPHLQILRRSRRPLLCGMEQARRSALAHHVHRTAPMGPRVLINGIWYKTATKPAWLVGAARVKYIDHSNDGWIEKLGEDERRLNVLMPFMLKNISYEHEKEVRALVIASWQQIESDGLDLQVSLNDFIDEIVDNHLCERGFGGAVVGVADLYGLVSKHRRSSLSPDVFYMDRKQGREQLGAPLKVDNASAPDTPVARGR